MAVINPFDFFLEPGAEIFPFAYDPALDSDFAPFRQTLPPGPLLQHYLAQIDRAPTRTIDFLVATKAREAAPELAKLAADDKTDGDVRDSARRAIELLWNPFLKS